ncbi:hypothetical protein [Bradyrhizobium diazoefficiens]|jgi:hypothetical protein|uniref:hypothetical protein n=1 Tax=Bradyrhizobium diazoefficiens TaxID=1355477 RepID=UPI001604C3F3|nr:hypothetical protein [Bradyrhizobium diazoefficiens]
MSRREAFGVSIRHQCTWEYRRRHVLIPLAFMWVLSPFRIKADMEKRFGYGR